MMGIYRYLQKSCWIVYGCAILVGGVMAGEQRLPETVSQVDLNRYLGTWYELSRLPNRFQDHCAGDVTAEYRRLENGDIEVINRCMDKGGRADEANGVARVVDTSSNAKLEVSFLSLFGWQLFWGDYWILELGSDYNYAVIGTPNRKYGWVLSRTPSLSPELWTHIQQVLIRNDYDPGEFVSTPQYAGNRDQNVPGKEAPGN